MLYDGSRDDLIGAASLGGKDVAVEARDEAPAGRVGLDAVHELPADGPLGDVDVGVEEGGEDDAVRASTVTRRRKRRGTRCGGTDVSDRPGVVAGEGAIGDEVDRAVGARVEDRTEDNLRAAHAGFTSCPIGFETILPSRKTVLPRTSVRRTSP